MLGWFSNRQRFGRIALATLTYVLMRSICLSIHLSTFVSISRNPKWYPVHSIHLYILIWPFKWEVFDNLDLWPWLHDYTILKVSFDFYFKYSLNNVSLKLSALNEAALSMFQKNCHYNVLLFIKWKPNGCKCCWIKKQIVQHCFI